MNQKIINPKQRRIDEKIILSSMLLAGAIFANEPFSVEVEGLQNGKFANENLLSKEYGFGCEGGNISPKISWKNAPKETKSFVLTIYDKDAPTGLGWVHWVVVNIPANATYLPKGVLADGTNLPSPALQTRTDFGMPGYGGACPPKGQKHDYVITLTALKVEALPNVSKDATPALVGFFTKANAIKEVKIVVSDGR